MFKYSLFQTNNTIPLDITGMSDICYFDNIPNEILEQILSFAMRARKDCPRSACNLYRCLRAVNSRFRQITEFTYATVSLPPL